MAKKVTIEKVRITIGKKVVELSVEELRELRDILNELCPSPTPAPIIIDRTPIYRRYWDWEPARIWCNEESRKFQTLCINANTTTDKTSEYTSCSN